MTPPVLVQFTFALWIDPMDECVTFARTIERNLLKAMNEMLEADGIAGEEIAEYMRFYGSSLSMAVDGWIEEERR